MLTAEPSFAHAHVMPTFPKASEFDLRNDTIGLNPFSNVSTLDNVFDEGVLID